MVMISLGIAIVERAMNSDKRFLSAPAMTWTLIYTTAMAVITMKLTGGFHLHTVGGDSLPNFSVNAHEYPEPLSAAGVVGFVDNGVLPGDTQAAGGQPHGPGRPVGHSPGSRGMAAQTSRVHPGAGQGHGGDVD